MSIKSSSASLKTALPMTKRLRSRSIVGDTPAPTAAEAKALLAAIEETSEAADQLIASLERYHRTFNACRSEIRTATAILHESNQFAIARRSADEATATTI